MTTAIISLCGLSGALHAQKTNTLPDNGNVGIGTTNPVGKLEIDQYFNDSSPAVYFYQPQASWGSIELFNAYRYIQTKSAAIDGNFKTFNVGGGGVTIGYGATPVYGSSDALYVNGRVGIATVTPTEMLTVNGNIQSILDNGTITGRNVAGLVSLGYSGPTGAQNWALRGVYQYANGVNLNAVGGDLDVIKSLNANTILATKTDGTPLGNVGIGTTSPGSALEVNGNIALTNGKGGSMIFQDGSKQATAWTGSLCGGDYAESIDVSGSRTNYEPGDVLVIDPREDGKFLKAAVPYSRAVAGVYSTKPGVVGRRQATAKNPDEVPMAVVGIVPAKVTAENGSIERGDLLVTSSTPGSLMKGSDYGRMLGAVVGKSLGTLTSGLGVIEVLVSLQ